MRHLLLALAGVILGGILFDKGGMVAGLVIGLLLSMLLTLQDRIRKLEEWAVRVSAAATADPAVKKTLTETAPAAGRDTAWSARPPRPTEPDLPAADSLDQPAPAPVAPPRPTPASTILLSEAPASTDVPPSAAGPARPDPVARLCRRVKDFFTTGNVVLRVGIIVLFFGVSFLLKYAAERNWVPIEFRLIGVALGGLGLLALGWRLRLRKPFYGLILQGGGIGILYLTIFAAAKLYHLLPMGLAMVVMVLLVALAGCLAVIQDARSLAVIGTVGGFLAPVLLSTDTGNHVLLFSYYALLNAGILGIAWFKAWRSLNLLGFVFTFVIASLWGHTSYRPEYFATTEPFLILFFLFYVAIVVLFALRQPLQLKGYLDGTLMFGVPLIAFALQYGLVRDYDYGLAFSALGLGIFYVGLATVLWRQQREGMRLVNEAFLALGVVFASLAIPLALDGRWTAAAWAMEGGALVWVGLRQRRLPARLFGLLLQPAAGFSFITTLYLPVGAWPILNSVYLGCLLISSAGLLTGYFFHWHRETIREWEKHFSVVFFTWGQLWWFGGGLHEIDCHLAGVAQHHATLLFIVGSGLPMVWLAGRLDWRLLIYPPFLLLPAMWLLGLAELVQGPGLHPFMRWGLPVWLATFAGQYRLLWRLEAQWPKQVVPLWHQLTLWLLMLLLSGEAAWLADRLTGTGSTWGFVGRGLVPAFIVLALLTNGKRLAWPVQRFAADYLGIGVIVPMLCLAGWVLLATVRAGDPAPLAYLPLLNPLELGQIFILLLLGHWLLQIRQARIPAVDGVSGQTLAALLAAVAFIAINGVVARAVHFLGDVPFRPWSLWRSNILQAAIAILWTTLALSLTIMATRTGRRQVWLTGAGLLGLVVAKLFLVDLAGQGTVARIVSFLVVGGLMLVIGYFSPLPPRHHEEKQ